MSHIWYIGVDIIKVKRIKSDTGKEVHHGYPGS